MAYEQKSKDSGDVSNKKPSFIAEKAFLLGTVVVYVAALAGVNILSVQRELSVLLLLTVVVRGTLKYMKYYAGNAIHETEFKSLSVIGHLVVGFLVLLYGAGAIGDVFLIIVSVQVAIVGAGYSRLLSVSVPSRDLVPNFVKTLDEYEG